MALALWPDFLGLTLSERVREGFFFLSNKHTESGKGHGSLVIRDVHLNGFIPAVTNEQDSVDQRAHRKTTASPN